MQRPCFLEYKEYRYLKLASLLAGIAVLAWWAVHPAAGGAYGGTWYGYVLGIASALLVLLLFWYGIRKRSTPRVADRRRGNRRKLMYAVAGGAASRRDNDRRRTRGEDHWRHGGTLQGWLSAHVYLGAALLVLVSLHSGFHFGWNIHTLAYILVLLVVASGIYGIFTYLRYPRLINESIGGDTLSDLLLKIAELDELARIRALGLPDEVNVLVMVQRQNTRLGGHFFQQLNCARSCQTELAAQGVQELSRKFVDGDQPRQMRDLYSVLLKKQRLVASARNAIRLNARMQFWLYLHAPLSIALLAALLAHVMTILVYW